MVFNPRKSLAVVISIILIGALIFSLFEYGIKSPLYAGMLLFFIVVLIAIIASDFKILKIGYGKFYFWLYAPEIKQKEKETLINMIDKLKIVYFSKQYFINFEQNRGPLKLVKSKENIAYLDSRWVWTNLKNGLTFKLMKEEIIDLPNSDKIKTYNPEPIGMGVVKEVKEVTILDVKWLEKQNNKDIMKRVKNDELKDLQIFAFIEIDKEFEDSDMNVLKNAYESMKEVYNSKYVV